MLGNGAKYTPVTPCERTRTCEQGTHVEVNRRSALCSASRRMRSSAHPRYGTSGPVSAALQGAAPEWRSATSVWRSSCHRTPIRSTRPIPHARPEWVWPCAIELHSRERSSRARGSGSWVSAMDFVCRTQQCGEGKATPNRHTYAFLHQTISGALNVTPLSHLDRGHVSLRT